MLLVKSRIRFAVSVSGNEKSSVVFTHLCARWLLSALGPIVVEALTNSNKNGGCSTENKYPFGVMSISNSFCHSRTKTWLGLIEIRCGLASARPKDLIF